MHRTRSTSLTALLLGASLLSGALFTRPALGARSDWAEGSPGGSDGATRDYYNRAGLLKWQNFMGDWRDAEDTPQGGVPFASASVADDDSGKWIEWDVSSLVRSWTESSVRDQGLFLRVIEGGGTTVFCSREHPASEQRPQLVVRGKRGSLTMAPAADTFLDRSTYRSQGDGEALRVSGNSQHTLLRFEMDRERIGTVSMATLRLYTTGQHGSATLGVFRCAQGHDLPPSEPVYGLAARSAFDEGLRDDSSVVFFADFEAETWADEWTNAADLKVIDPVGADPQRGFEPLRGSALRVRIAKGSTGALNTTFKFMKELGKEPDEVYLRYYLRLASDWNQTLQGGKLPGISGTYGVAGWGGRKSDGRNGWSARGSFHLTIPQNNPLGGLHPIGTYCYHADMRGRFGDIWLWQEDYRGFLETGRWYSIEQYVKLNTPGNRDGVIRAWVDGRLAFEKSDIRFRHVDSLKIEQIWMNVYHGGTRPSPYDQHLYIDNVVIATRYVGPMKPAE